MDNASMDLNVAQTLDAGNVEIYVDKVGYDIFQSKIILLLLQCTMIMKYDSV